MINLLWVVKKKVRLFLLLYFSLTFSFAQEICFNGIDDDGDGLIDCYDNDCSDSIYCNGFFLSKPKAPLNCRYYPERDSIMKMELVWTTQEIEAAHLTNCAVGDIDQDGIIEVLTFSFGQIKIINGSTGTVKSSISIPSAYTSTPFYELAIADVDNDGYGDIFTAAFLNATLDFYLLRFNHNGSLVWSQKTDKNFIDFHEVITPFVANFNGDDTVEVSVLGEIFNSITGERKIVIHDTTLKSPVASLQSIAMDILPDAFCSACDGLEYITGNHIYSIDLINDTAILVSSINLPRGIPSIADINQDELLDVIVVAPSKWAYGGLSPSDSTLIYAWDPRDTSLFGRITIYNNGNGGRANIANYDDDSDIEIGFAGARNYIAIDNNFSILWEKPVSDTSSSLTGSSVFDFNCDGKKEVVYRDEQFLYIINAQNGLTLDSFPCRSGTIVEYPIIADITNDGQANILCGCQDESNISKSNYRLFKSQNNDWVGTRSVWNQFSYFGVNINDDLTVPKVQQNQAHSSLSELNTYLNQPTLVDEFGNPICFIELQDLSINIDSIIYECDSALIYGTVCNLSLSDIVSSNIPIELYSEHPENGGTILIHDSINDILSAETCITFLYKIPVGDYLLYMLVNSDSSSFNTLFMECDSLNNHDTLTIIEDLLVLDIVEDSVFIEQGMSYHIRVSLEPDPLIFNWSPITFLSDVNIIEPITIPEEDILYYLTVESSTGCILTDSIFIKVINKTVAFPDVFSPNGDNLNDFFSPIYNEGVKEVMQFTIYNRWGEVIFDNNEYGTSWDGTYKNQLQEIGLYKYLFKAKFQDDQIIIYSGNLILAK